MAKKTSRLTEKQLSWLLTTGYKRYCLWELAKKLKIDNVTILLYHLRKHNLKALKRPEQIRRRLMRLFNKNEFISFTQAALKLNTCTQLIRQIAKEQNILPSSSTSLNLMRNRWKKQIGEPRQKKKYKLKDKKQPVKPVVSKKQKIEHIREMLSKQNRAKW